MSRQPRAYRLDDPDVTGGAVQVTEEPFDAIEAADGVVVPMGERRRAPWLGILVSALSGLILMGLGLALENLIADLYAIAPWLGWVALALAAVTGLAFLAIVGREVSGIWREQKIEKLRETAVDALAVKMRKESGGDKPQAKMILSFISPPDRPAWRYLYRAEVSCPSRCFPLSPL